MLGKILKRLKNEQGQALIELALTLPVLIMILGGIIDFGWIFTNQNIVDNLAREGARYAIVHSTGSDPKTAIINYTKSIAPSNVSDSIIVTVTFSNSYKPRNGDVKVEVSNDVKVLTPIVGVFTQDQTMALNSSCTMKVE